MRTLLSELIPGLYITAYWTVNSTVFLLRRFSGPLQSNTGPSGLPFRKVRQNFEAIRRLRFVSSPPEDLTRIRLQLAIYFGLHRGSLTKTLQKVNRDSGKSCAQ